MNDRSTCKSGLCRRDASSNVYENKKKEQTDKYANQHNTAPHNDQNDEALEVNVRNNHNRSLARETGAPEIVIAGNQQ
jgi:hypothetical protein